MLLLLTYVLGKSGNMAFLHKIWEFPDGSWKNRRPVTPSGHASFAFIVKPPGVGDKLLETGEF